MHRDGCGRPSATCPTPTVRTGAADNKTPLDHPLAQKNGSLEKFLRERGGKTAGELAPQANAFTP
jgi:hypothetical protein